MSATDPFENPKALARDLREKVGLSAGYASDLSSGIRRPSLELAVRIEGHLGIPASAWVARPVRVARHTQDAAA